MACLSTIAIKLKRTGTGSPQQRLILAWVIVAYLICGFAADTWAQTYRGKVVDAETGQPLEGAVVVIVWEKKLFIGGDSPQSFHSAKEALTDAKGEFSVDGSPGINWNPFTYLRDEPDVAIFMPGYGPFPTGHVKDLPVVEMKKSMTGPGAVIKLPKLKTQEEMRRFAGTSALHISSRTPDEEIPNLIRLINIHRKLAGLSSQIGPSAR